MNDAQLHTLEQLRAFFNGTVTVAVGFSVAAHERYDFVARTVRRFGYSKTDVDSERKMPIIRSGAY